MYTSQVIRGGVQTLPYRWPSAPTERRPITSQIRRLLLLPSHPKTCVLCVKCSWIHSLLEKETQGSRLVDWLYLNLSFGELLKLLIFAPHQRCQLLANSLLFFPLLGHKFKDKKPKKSGCILKLFSSLDLSSGKFNVMEMVKSPTA